jgi:hypothetical protein
MLNAVTSPITASRIIGTPHRIIATHAISNGSEIRLKILLINAIADIISSTISFFVPPTSKIFSNFSINVFK